MHIPASTYRVQLNQKFNFTDLKEVSQYLSRLGITDIYASPFFKSRTGSTHGYDVVDPMVINPELGSKEDFNALFGELENLSLGWVQDIVPNHMALDSQNKWLMDVFEKGKLSAYYRYFDFDLENIYSGLKGKVLVPFLGKFFGLCLENQEIQICYNAQGLFVSYYELRIPLNISSYLDVFFLKDGSPKDSKRRSPALEEFYKIKSQIQRISREKKEDAFAEAFERIKQRLWACYKKDKQVKKIVEQNLLLYNGKKGDRSSFDRLEQLLTKQYFRLAFWKYASEEINYRRFFNINQLISLKVECKEVFDHTHQLIKEMTVYDVFRGVRVDHIDGLYDPYRYLQRLREVIQGRYLVVEKILDLDEDLPENWPVEGTTGYQFLNYVNGVFCDSKNEKSFNKLYERFIEGVIDFNELVIAKKRLIIGKHMAGDIDNLAHLMKRVAHKDRFGKDITHYGLKRALVEVMANFPVYRTYVDSEDISKVDKNVVAKAITGSLRKNPSLEYELDFIRGILLLEFPSYLDEKERAQWVDFVMRFQQYTGPLMAKGFEDTSLYIYNRLLSLNEVGSEPQKFGVSLREFHGYIQKTMRRFPHQLNATATHDTKRGEDMRSRLNVLSEMPGRWNKQVRRWARINKSKKIKIDQKVCPEGNDEYFFYQTLLGSMPFDQMIDQAYRQRIKDYIIKAVREAKVHTAWIQPDEQYEKGYLEFIDRVLDPVSSNTFLQELMTFQKSIAHFGAFNSLSQILIKLTSPGIPDIYQGTELWDLNLVDPDNRRPVDYQLRKYYLDQLRGVAQEAFPGLIEEILKNKEDGRIKMYIIHKALELRKRNEELFKTARYQPVKVEGKYKNCVIAYLRRSKGDFVLTVVPRFLTRVINANQTPLAKVWKNTRLRLPKVIKGTDVFTGISHQGKDMYLKDVFKSLPCALITDEENHEQKS